MPEITVDQIKEAVGTQPELKTALFSSFKSDFQKSLESEGVIIRTKDEEAAYLRSYEDKVLPTKVDAAFNEKFKASLDEMDNSVIELTGAKKGPHEKTSEFVKRAIKELGARGGDSVTKEKVAQLEKMLEEKESTWSKKYQDALTAAQNKELEIDASLALNDKQFPLPLHIKTDEDKQKYTEAQKRMVKTDFFNSYKPKRDAEGNIVYYEGDKALLNSKDGKPLSAKEIIEERYSNFFMPAGRKAEGTGQGSNGVVLTPGDFKSTDDIHKYLAAKGIAAGTKEYAEELEKLSAEAKIKI